MTAPPDPEDVYALTRDELIDRIHKLRAGLGVAIGPSEVVLAPARVSGRNVQNLLTGLEGLGIDASELFAGLDVNLEAASRPNAWIPWDLFMALLQRLCDAKGEETVRAMGAQALKSPALNMVGVVGWTFAGAENLFDWMVRLTFRDEGLFFRGIHGEVHRISEWNLQVVLTSEVATFSRAFAVALAGTSERLPVLVGAPPCGVDVDVSPRRCVLDVHLKPHRSPGRTIQRLFRRDRSLEAAAELRTVYMRLVEQNQVLEEKLQELEDSRRAEEELAGRLRQVQRMEAVGRFAGAITHDFNNLLTVILTHTGFVADDLEEGSEVRHDAEVIIDTAHRAAALTRQLAAFGQPRAAHPELIDLSDLIDEATPLLRTLAGSRVDVHLELSPDLPPLLGDRSQLEQVVVNLVLNAKEAMADRGALEVEVSHQHLDDEGAEAHPGLHAGPHVHLRVQDEGRGIPAEVQPRIFEPLFTTKSPGGGNGLGLSTVYGVVNQMGGAVWVESELGKGATLHVLLPCAEDVAAPAPPEPVRLEAPDSDEAAKILFIDDDPLIRRATERILAGAGYDVVSASSGEDALRLLRGGLRPHLVVSDVIMPGLRGEPLLEALRDAMGPVPVLLVSGYADADFDLGRLPPGVEFLPKPYDPPTLLSCMARLLVAERRDDDAPG